MPLVKFHIIRISRFILPLGALLFILGGCVEKMVLPEDPNVSNELSAGDTTYLQINPVWDESIGLQTPLDLSIAQDGHIFIADSAARKIVVLEQSGVIASGFDALSDLRNENGESLYPIDVDIDSKMSVFYIDGSNRIFTWNHFRFNTGIDSVIESAVFEIGQTGQRVTVLYGTAEWFEYLNHPEINLVESNWSADQEQINRYLEPRLFYDGFNDQDHETARYSAISTVDDDNNHLYVTDYVNDRILEIYYARDNLIRLSSGDTVWTYLGIRLRESQDYGTGAGTVNKPLGLDIDYDNSLYYCQVGEYFAVHKIYPDVSQGYLVYKSRFTAFQDDIMDLDRFTAPRDIAVDDNQMVYVSNSGAREIQIFNSDGSFFKKAGVDQYSLDRDLGYPDNPGAIVVDSTEYLYIVEEKGLLQSPAGLTVDERGVIYVCDPAQSSIFRFRLSNVLDEDLNPE